MTPDELDRWAAEKVMGLIPFTSYEPAVAILRAAYEALN